MAARPPLDERIWDARAAVYGHLARTGRAPAPELVATELGLDESAGEALFALLDARHMILLAADGRTIHMAFPFSGVPTGFRAHVNGISYYANCAWDALGIPAALHATDADCEITDPLDGSTLRVQVRGGQVVGSGLMHFVVPFAHWYDDLVAT